jgi:hypothetical protein
MSELTQVLTSSSPWVAALAILAGALVTTWKIYFQYKARISEAQLTEGAVRSQLTSDSLDNLSQLLVENFRTLDSFYSENLSQYRTSSIASIAIAVLGFVVIISGVLLALIGNQVTLQIQRKLLGFSRY